MRKTPLLSATILAVAISGVPEFVAANGLDVELNRQIVAFHKSHGIPPRFGRTVWRNEQRYYRWCFSDLETARAFVEQFGGAFYKTTWTTVAGCSSTG